MLTRIRNAIAVSKNEITLPYSKFKEDLAQILKDYQLIESLKLNKKTSQFNKTLRIESIKDQVNPKITKIDRISALQEDESIPVQTKIPKNQKWTRLSDCVYDAMD